MVYQNKYKRKGRSLMLKELETELNWTLTENRILNRNHCIGISSLSHFLLSIEIEMLHNIFKCIETQFDKYTCPRQFFSGFGFCTLLFQYNTSLHRCRSSLFYVLSLFACVIISNFPRFYCVFQKCILRLKKRSKVNDYFAIISY